MTELAEIFGNIFVLLVYRGHFTLKCHILMAKWSVRVRLCWIKESFIMELNSSQAIMCWMVDLSAKRCPDQSILTVFDMI